MSSSIATTTATADLLAINRELTGASTGYMTELRDAWEELLSEAHQVSSDVVELSALSGAELGPLTVFLERCPDAIASFQHVSVHGPSKGWARSIKDLVGVLIALPAAVAGVVMHPDSMGDIASFAPLGERLWLENMDTRKGDGRTVDELFRCFAAVKNARFCFDIAHARLHDPSMELAHALLDTFGERLAEVHLSSIEQDGTHIPLLDEDLERFAPVLVRCTGVPWILEAPLPKTWL
jgi:hypothetical protein